MGNSKKHIICDSLAIAKGFTSLPVLTLLLAATLWGVFWYPLRGLEAGGFSGLGATLFIYVGASLHLLYFLRGHLRDFRHHSGALFLLGLATGWCNISFILAILDGNVVRVLLLFYLSPLWTTLLAVWFLKERLDGFSMLILLLALGGAVVMLWQPALGAPWPQGRADWLALSSGFTFAIANIITRKLHDAVSIQSKTAATWVGVLVLTTIGLAFGSQGMGSPSASVILVALLLGFIGMYMMTMSVQYGVTHMPAHRSAVILLFEVVAGAVSAYWLTDESMRPLEWLGGSLVVLAALGTARRQAHD
ncbi:MAG: DMT family transporter [Gammaproteobacteria bacterium]